MTRTLPWRGLPAIIVCSLIGTVVAATQAQPPTSQPTSAPAEQQAVLARVIEVQGDVQHAPLGGTDWQPCAVGDEYPQETVIRTGIRSSAKFQIGDEEPYTVLVVESASKTIISEAYKTDTAKRVRIGVGYGRIRAGVAEGGLQSDFTVDSPVATLSKRGTWDFGLAYERGTERFDVFLLDRGLVQVLHEVTGQRRGLLPGEILTQAMRRWADEAQVRRNVPVPDLLGQGDIDVAFNRIRQDGLGVTDPASGRRVLIDLSNSMSQAEFANLLGTRLATLPSLRHGVGNLVQEEGFFGTGRGDDLIPVMIGADSNLVQKGAARPGTYKFRRAALENWLKEYRNH
ncbi:MAG: FecR domain-containing protein [Phycisphaerae bacterium]|jgi:hypothetical protein